MENKNPVWGIVMPSKTWHLSPDCPSLLPCVSNVSGVVVKYEDEDTAFRAGHCQPCARCTSDTLVESATGVYVKLTGHQINTIKSITQIHDRTKKALTLKEISGAIGKSLTFTFMTVNQLKKKGLLQKIYGRRGKKAVNRSIIPTDLALTVLARLPKA